METVETREESYKTHVNVQRAKKDEMDSRDIQDCILFVTEKKDFKRPTIISWFWKIDLKMIIKWPSSISSLQVCHFWGDGVSLSLSVKKLWLGKSSEIQTAFMAFPYE